jgi:hypothetical protein
MLAPLRKRLEEEKRVPEYDIACTKKMYRFTPVIYFVFNVPCKHVGLEYLELSERKSFLDFAHTSGPVLSVTPSVINSHVARTVKPTA